MSKRCVFAMLAAPQRGHVGRTEPQCMDSINRIVELLHHQPYVKATFTVRRGDVDVVAFKHDLQAAAAVAVPGDLAVVMFAGHGDDVKNPDQGWTFTGGRLGNKELADALCEFGDGVEVVVVSDACWGYDVIVPPLPDDLGGPFFRKLRRRISVNLERGSDPTQPGPRPGPDFVFIWSAISLKQRSLATSLFALHLAQDPLRDVNPRYVELQQRLEANCKLACEEWGLSCSDDAIAYRASFSAERP